MADISKIRFEEENKEYHIKDSAAWEQIESLSAEEIFYDDSNSIITADDVQEAIDLITTQLKPVLTVNIDSDSSITLTNGITTLTGTSVDGSFTTELPKVGTWNISATKNNRTTTISIEINEIGKNYSITLEYFTASLAISTYNGATVNVIGGGYNLTQVAAEGVANFTLQKSGTYSVSASYDGNSSETKSITATTDGQSLTTIINFLILSLTAPENSDIEITDGTTTITGTGSGAAQEYLLPNTGTWTATAELDGKTTSDSIVVSSYQTYTMELSFVHIYGVDWSGSGTTLSRTDDSALFVDPVPYMNDDNHPGSSPFDSLIPWSGMIKETIDGNSFVRIPKFWYKITKENGHLKIQIADEETSGFYVSPAHRARGSESEYDYVWIGRYHCDNDYKSTSGSVPKANITRAAARTGCHNLGSEYWMLDFSMWVTVWLLYIVEFANWDSQAMIGYNCGNNSSKEASGTTDSMPYHTGTIKSSRSTYGVGVQYRYIEDPWGNVLDWCDGITFNQANIYCFEDPADYSDSYQSTGATLVGTRPTSSNFIQDFGVSAETGYEWFLYPSNVGGSKTNVPDGCYYDSAGVVLRVGGYFYQYAYYGLFCLSGYDGASGRSAGIGVRLQRRGAIPA